MGLVDRWRGLRDLGVKPRWVVTADVLVTVLAGFFLVLVLVLGTVAYHSGDIAQDDYYDIWLCCVGVLLPLMLGSGMRLLAHYETSVQDIVRKELWPPVITLTLALFALQPVPHDSELFKMLVVPVLGLMTASMWVSLVRLVLVTGSVAREARESSTTTPAAASETDTMGQP